MTRFTQNVTWDGVVSRIEHCSSLKRTSYVKICLQWMKHLKGWSTVCIYSLGEEIFHPLKHKIQKCVCVYWLWRDIKLSCQSNHLSTDGTDNLNFFVKAITFSCFLSLSLSYSIWRSYSVLIDTRLGVSVNWTVLLYCGMWTVVEQFGII